MAASISNIDETSPVDLGSLLDARKGAVVTLVSGETQLAAHRAVLAARSPVFEAMFRHDTRESSSGEVKVDDVAGPVLRQLLVYCYTLVVPQLASMALQLLPAADKYGLLALRAECEEQLVQQLTVETAAATAAVALRHSCVSLRKAAASFIKAHHFEVVMSKGWADVLVGNPDLAVDLTRLIAEPSAEASAPPAAAAVAAASGPNASQSQAPGHLTPPPDEAAVARYRSLSAREKGERLREAAKQGSEGAVRALLAAGADVGSEDGGSRLTALHWAAGRGHAAVVRLLAAASADLNCRDVFGQTPLHFAALNGRAEAAAALLQLGADRAARDNWGRTPLDYARERNDQQLVELLSSR